MSIADGEDFRYEIGRLIAEKGILITVLVLIAYIPFCACMIPFSIVRGRSDG